MPQQAIKEYEHSIFLIRKIKARIRRRIKLAMEFTAYRYTLEYKLELLNVIQGDMKRLCSKHDERHANFANHLNR